jgi:hypothetical protein
MESRSSVSGRWMLAWSASLAALTAIAGYIQTVGTGSLPFWMPFISETSLFHPVDDWFKLGLTASALGFVPVALWVHERTAKSAARLGRLAERLNHLMLVFAIIGLAGLIGLAYFDWKNAPVQHIIGASLFFATQAAWASSTSAITFLATGGALTGALRLRLIGAFGALIFLSAQVLLMVWTNQLHLTEMPENALGRTNGENFAALFEWAAVAALSLHSFGLWQPRKRKNKSDRKINSTP